ncbi:hypothetical protein LAG90_07165 [Marinilongibacter aquaticus]|uniref:hypothetical protein n=1 Tax=Marinilongibacter aquaticus TaxID=2975157 RepID=UPI0021BD2826|nr:hypothetical protein [Marinilongibacter aquaticus]UBM60423.1 hypothetical protein LAG90_07165 [Marinilongibacter aquaticus]
MDKKEIEKSRFGALARGLKYGTAFLCIAFLFGAIYGLLVAEPFRPAFAMASFIGIFVLLNFLFSLLYGLVKTFVRLFRGQSLHGFRYLGISLGFALVFFLYFLGQKLLGFYYY